MDLSNLSKKDYETIRNYIKLTISNLLNIYIKLCQITTPSSPTNRKQKLNSLSNKINSLDYFTELTCELFKDYTIGIVIWSDFFSNKESFDKKLLKGNIYIYQNTNGSWKFSF